MEIAVALVAGFALGAALCACAYRRELARMARFLRERDARSNARLTVRTPGRALRELADAVNAQLDAAQVERLAHRRSREDFQRQLSALSHDVRTPLAGAKGYVQLAGDALAAQAGGAEAGSGAAAGAGAGSAAADGAAGRYLASAVRRLDDAAVLLDDLFAYAQASDPDAAPDMQPVAVLPVLAGVLAGHFPAFDERGWEPRIAFSDEGFTVEADASALARIFDNLVANALRHGAAAPEVVQAGARVTFRNRVADPASIDAARLFERFYRADGARTGRGAGLGLSVVAALAESMGMRACARLEGDMLCVDLDFCR